MLRGISVTHITRNLIYPLQGDTNHIYQYGDLRKDLLSRINQFFKQSTSCNDYYQLAKYLTKNLCCTLISRYQLIHHQESSI
jgi:hypothetical protein